MNDIEYHQAQVRARLEWYIENFEKPKWMDFFGLYPAMNAVEASKAQLKAMKENGILISIKDTCKNIDLDSSHASN